MTNAPPPLHPRSGEKPPFARTAAQFCAWSPLIAIGMNIFLGGMARSGNPGTQAMVFIGPLVMILGIVLGIVALCGIPKHGKKGILIPSVIGLTINIAFIVLALTAGVRRFERDGALKAKTETEQREPTR